MHGGGNQPLPAEDMKADSHWSRLHAYVLPEITQIIWPSPCVLRLLGDQLGKTAKGSVASHVLAQRQLL
jgi:hypothetical protein